MQRSGVTTIPILAATILLAGCGVDPGLGQRGIASGTERFNPLTEAMPLPQGHPPVPGRPPALPEGHPPIPEAHPACPGGGALPQWGLDQNPDGRVRAPEIIST